MTTCPLSTTTREELDFSLFPLGAMADKATVRAHADRLGIQVAAKPDSQDICFVPDGSYADVVARLRPDAMEPGELVAADGRILGTHAGIARYTIGQAKRLGPATQDRGQRQVVVALDPGRRRVVLGPQAAATQDVFLRELNWLIDPPSAPLRCTVKLRARETPQPATIVPDSDGVRVHLDMPGAPAPTSPMTI